jgi:hypothetical protein
VLIFIVERKATTTVLQDGATIDFIDDGENAEPRSRRCNISDAIGPRADIDQMLLTGID